MSHPIPPDVTPIPSDSIRSNPIQSDPIRSHPVPPDPTRQSLRFEFSDNPWRGNTGQGWWLLQIYSYFASCSHQPTGASAFRLDPPGCSAVVVCADRLSLVQCILSFTLAFLCLTLKILIGPASDQGSTTWRLCPHPLRDALSAASARMRAWVRLDSAVGYWPLPRRHLLGALGLGIGALLPLPMLWRTGVNFHYTDSGGAAERGYALVASQACCSEPIVLVAVWPVWRIVRVACVVSVAYSLCSL